MATTVTSEQPRSVRSGARPLRRARTPPRRRWCRGGPPTRPARSGAPPCAPSSTASSPDLHVAVGSDVDEHLVHGDHADHRVAAAADEHLLALEPEPPEHPVGVADGERGDGGVALDGVQEAVGHPLPGGERLHEGHLGGEPHRGLEREPVDERRARARCRTRRCRSARGRSGSPGGRWRRRSWRRGASAPGCPARSTAATAASNRSSWSAVNGSSGSSATAQWVHSPSSDRSGSACTSSARRTTSSGAAPTRCIPVSTLRWTGTGSPPARAADASRRMSGSV